MPVNTFEEILKHTNDVNKTISYLKIDIEGSELKSIPTWLESGVLNNVQQIGIELHTGVLHIQDQKIGSTLSEMLKAFKTMSEKYGLKIIDYTPNGCVGKSQDKLEKRYHTYFDIVLYKK